MNLHYVDTSALVRCYFPDEADHDELRALILESSPAVVTTELARVELASAARAAHRAGRLKDPGRLLARLDADCGADGPVALLALDAPVVLPLARQLVLDHDLRTLDAIHLAVAATTARQLADAGRPPDDGDDIVVVTRDQRQAAAARAMGFAVR